MQLGKSTMRDNRTAILRIACVGALAIGLGGCIIPYNRAVLPGIDTRLVDANTGAPVAGARVTLSVPRPERSKLKPLTLVSGPDGAVKAEPVKELIFVMPATDIGPGRGVMRVEADGYEPYEVETWAAFMRNPAILGLTTKLTPKTK